MQVAIQNTMKGLLYIDFIKRGSYRSMVMMLHRGTCLSYRSQGKDHTDQKQNLKKPDFKSILH